MREETFIRDSNKVWW